MRRSPIGRFDEVASDLVARRDAKKEKRRAQQIGKRVDDPIALAGIMKPIDHPLDEPRVSHDLAKHGGPRFPGQPLGSGFDAKGLVERGTEQR